MCGAASCLPAIAATTATTATTAKHDPKPATTVRLASKSKVDMMDLAPADEYFGPLKLSELGINNTIRDLGRRYDVNHDNFEQTLESAELTERSIRDWEHKYPHDTQLPRLVYFLQRLYTKVLFQPARDRAHATALWLFADFKSSPQAKQLKKTLATEHLAPLPVPTPRPTPTALPTIFAPPETVPPPVREPPSASALPSAVP
jgi:hypothetical protein